jgi:hypothetical protein
LGNLRYDGGSMGFPGFQTYFIQNSLLFPEIKIIYLGPKPR